MKLIRCFVQAVLIMIPMYLIALVVHGADAQTWFWVGFVVVLVLWILTPTKEYRDALKERDDADA